jgi:hypothetical protein
MKRPKTKKSFDCLDFKDQAQTRINRETKGMTWDKEVEYLRRKALNGPFAELARSKESETAGVAMARERKSTYRGKP